ncbi:uncharacterized protein LOC142632349 [Castanea sativa]|uniref:uncharacterized protein LOC142632349 n=1 Tax=Castanea sativa TaxID=21020 RepID=UPI003F64EEC4
MGPFLTAERQLKFLVVGINYFTKWVEVEAWPLSRRRISEVSCGTSFAGIRNYYSSPARPQANRTTAKTPTGETLFHLAYGSEAIIPAKVRLMSYQVGSHDESKNDKAMRLELDLVDEVRATVEQRLSRYQNLMAKHYNSKVRHRDFQVGDLVLRKVIGATKDAS